MLWSYFEQAKQSEIMLRHVQIQYRVKHKTQQLDPSSSWLNRSISQVVDLTPEGVKLLVYSKDCFPYENDHVQLNISYQLLVYSTLYTEIFILTSTNL